jgi:trk system potassium uptake protein TrkA
VTGGASYPDTLLEAGAQDAEMLIAVTNSDEINMMACQVAHTFFRTPQKISRVRSQAYLDYQETAVRLRTTSPWMSSSARSS